MSNDTISESFRTPEEDAILSEFQWRADCGTQWQLWHKGDLRGTSWDRKDVEHAAEHLYAKADGSFPNLRWKEKSAGEHNETDYANLEVEAPGGVRWMTTPTFIVNVAVAIPARCC